jgi:hypothetical protein
MKPEIFAQACAVGRDVAVIVWVLYWFVSH